MIGQRILKAGIGGSGNYLVWRILRSLQQAAGVYRSFRIESGLSDAIRHIIATRQDLGYRGVYRWPEEAEMDVLWDESHELHELGCRRLRCNPALVNNVSSLLWVGDEPLVARLTYTRRQRVYVHRDPRDVVASMLHKVVRADNLAINPQYQARTVEEAIALPGYVERLAQKWRTHVFNYLNEPHGAWVPVPYASLIGDGKRDAIEALAATLGLPCGKLVLDRIMVQTDVTRARVHVPLQVVRAAPGGGVALGIADRVEAVCAKEMEALGYAVTSV